MEPINEPKLKSKCLSIMENIMTVIGWSVLGYFLVRMATFLVWVIFGRMYYENLFNREVIWGTILLFSAVLTLAFFTFSIMWFWMFYNFKRYAHLNRRRFAAVVKEEELAVLFGLDTKLINSLRTNRWSELDEGEEKRLFLVNFKEIQNNVRLR